MRVLLATVILAALAACAQAPGGQGLLIERSGGDYDDHSFGPDGKGGFVDNHTGAAVDASGNPAK